MYLTFAMFLFEYLTYKIDNPQKKYENFLLILFFALYTYTSIVIRYLTFEMFLCESWGMVSNMRIIYIPFDNFN